MNIWCYQAESMEEKIPNCKPPLWRSVFALVGLLTLRLSL